MGLFGLSRSEKVIWKVIKPFDKLMMMIDDDPQEVYQSRVVEIADAFITIETPMIGNTFLELTPQTKVGVELYTPDGGKIRFVSKVQCQEWLNERVIKLRRPRNVERVQLRSYYRLEILLYAEYSFVAAKQLHAKSTDLSYPIFAAITKDISETGVLLITDRYIDKGILINTKIKFPDKSTVKARAKVLRTLELSVKGKYGIGLGFVYMSEDDREALRRFIFKNSKKNISRQ